MGQRKLAHAEKQRSQISFICLGWPVVPAIHEHRRIVFMDRRDKPGDDDFFVGHSKNSVPLSVCVQLIPSGVCGISG